MLQFTFLFCNSLVMVIVDTVVPRDFLDILLVTYLVTPEAP